MFGVKTRLKKYIDRMIVELLPKPDEKPSYLALEILMERYGYLRSIETKLPVAADGSPVPWYTYPAIEYFNQLDARGLKVFEFGSGNSSLYWARKGADVWSVEHDPNWYESMIARSAQLRGLSLRESADAYAQAIKDTGQQFDIIIIDGAWRIESAKAAMPYLRPGGMIILDNSDWYTDVSIILKERGYFQVDFNGFGPINNYCWTTSILLKLDSNLKQIISHPRPIGGIEVFKGDKW